MPDRRHRVTPEPIHNRPTLSSIDYRVGTYASFRRAMLEAIATHVREPDEPAAGAWPAPSHRPLEPWTTRSSDDYGIAFVEMWAYIADVLTFYQERIANEALLRTATQPASVTYLASLIGYRPAPGRAATAHLAFHVDDRAEVRLAADLLVQSVPGQDEQPQKFETIEGLAATAALNVVRPRTRQPQTLPRGARRAVLDGVGLDVSPGDWVAVVGDERREDPTSERWDLRRLATVTEDPATQTTTISWDRGLGWQAPEGGPTIEPPGDPEVWLFRRQASPFGHNAPDWRLLAASPAFVVTDAQGDPGYLFPDWNDKRLPEDETKPQHLFLDAVYPGLVAGQWVALVAADGAERGDYVELYPVRDVAETTRVNYTLSAKVTRLTIDTVESTGQPENIESFGMRDTTVLIESERLPLADVALGHSPTDDSHDEPQPVADDRLELDGHYPDLHRERRLLVTGSRVDGGDTGVEAVEVAAVDHDDGRTTVTLATPLAYAYQRASVRIHGNVARATHGETVAGEVLGDGDASRRFQTFELRQRPVTYVPRPGAPGGVVSTVAVRVNGVVWEEVAELHERAPDERIYVARRRPDDTLTVRFGDGDTGARPPSGRANVEASYRVGLGPAGNVGADTLRTLLTKPLGLEAATNPAAANGGASPEGPASVKDTAPGTVRTFGRIVALRDFEDAAREYVGIAKASATWRWDGEQRVVVLVVARDDGASIEPIASDLRADLDARRDPHQPLRLRDFVPMPVSVGLAVVVDRAHSIERVEDAADTALRAVFAFEALALGQTVHLSDVYRAVQQVEGVVAVHVEAFHFKHPAAREARGDDAPVQPRLLIAPDELARVDDPDDVRVIGARHPQGGPA